MVDKLNNSISFECEIKEIKSRTSASQDKIGRMVIEFYPADHILDGLNKLHRTDKTVTIALVENPEADFNG